jgi:hypothetical protein
MEQLVQTLFLAPLHPQVVVMAASGVYQVEAGVLGAVLEIERQTPVEREIPLLYPLLKVITVEVAEGVMNQTAVVAVAALQRLAVPAVEILLLMEVMAVLAQRLLFLVLL